MIPTEKSTPKPESESQELQEARDKLEEAYREARLASGEQPSGDGRDTVNEDVVQQQESDQGLDKAA